MSVLNASSYSTALEKVKCPNKFPIESLARSDALNMRHTHTGPGKHAMDGGSTEGIHVRHNQAAASAARGRGSLWHCPVLCPEQEQPWAQLSVNTELSAVLVWSTANSAL